VKIESLFFSQEEREKQLGEWNETEREYPSEKNLHELILGDVGARSAQEAVIVEGNRAYTYREIGKLSDQVASSLLSKGVKPQEFVPIVLESGIDFIVALLGTLKAGSIYVPLSPDTPDEKLQQVLERIKAKTVITSADLKDRLEGHDIEVLDIEDLKEGGQTSLQGLSRPDDLACAFYSFDDQEKVRLIPFTHRSWVNTVYARKSAFDSPVKRLALLYPPESDKASLTIFWALMEGASLVIPSAIKNWGDTQGILELLSNSQVSHLLCSPGIYRSLLRTAGAKELQSLELISLTGEPWSTDLAQQHIALCPQASLYNEYGLKETGSWNTLARVFDKKSQKCEEVTIGCPIANTQVYIFNDQQQLVPVGVKGEIYIGGIGLLPSSTHSQISERLIPHPYKQGEVLYRTGDIGLYLEDGRIDYMGQRACQISFRGNQIEVEQIEQVLYKHPKVEAAAVSLGNPRTSQERLVGYVQWAGGVPEDTQQAEEEIQKLLKNHLVSYMIPQTWVFVDALKKTSSGKIDRTSLPAIKYEEKAFSIESSTETRSEVEERLVEIWKEILNLDQVSIKDNFFEVGGDSILSIQLVSQARQQGLEFNMEQVFETPTIEELAPFVKITSEQKEKKQEAPLSHQSCTLSPIQYWFLNQEGNNFNHYNQAVLLESKEGIEEEALEKALQSLIRTHKSLQLRFYKDENGTWSQRYEEYESLEEYKKGICRIEDLEGLSNEEVKKKQLEVAEEVQKSLNIQQGPLFQGVLFKEGAKDTLLLVCHHLVVDSVSWRILIEDLEAAYKQALEGKEEIDLPEGTRSYGWWTEALEKLANEEAYQEEISYWEDVLDQQGDPLPRDREGAGENTVEHMGEVTAELPIDLTQKLLQEVPSAYRTQINDILLTALGYAVQEWTGTKRIGLMLEGHGREQLTEEMDLSRTVGWFTSIYPVVLDLEGVESIGSGIKKVKETLRQIPRKGVGYGMLKYLTEEGRKRLSNKEEPDLSFNYLGQVDAGGQKGLFKYTEGSTGSYTSPQNHRPRILEVNSQVINGHLNVHIGYSTHLHSKETITSLSKKFIDALKKIITHCCKEKNFGYTPSDFPLAKINQEQLDQVFGDIANIEDIYPLSPMQEGLLFQKLFHPNSKAYLVQSLFEINQDLDVGILKKSWEVLIGHYDILRTGFKYEHLPHFLQFVSRKVDVPWKEYECSSLSNEALQEKINNLLEEDRAQEFDYKKPPLMRFHLIKASLNHHYLVFTFHHILIDGWCSSILMNDLATIYSRLKERKVPKLQPQKSYRTFIEWLGIYDYTQTEEFWKTYLKDINITKLSDSVIKKDRSYTEEEFCNYQYVLPPEQSQLLKDFAKTEQMTLNILFQAAWYLLLRYYTQQSDVTFGAIQSGRSIPIEGIDHMIGLFINALPIRANFEDQESTIKDLLRNLSKSLPQLQKSSHVPLFEIQKWAGIREKNALFDTLFVFENYYKAPERESRSSLDLQFVKGYEPTEYPLTLLVVPKGEILLDVTYKTENFDKDQIKSIIDHFINILDTIRKNSSALLTQVNPITDEEKTKILEIWNDTEKNYPENETIHGLFEEQVIKTPKKDAVVYEDIALTFEDLNAKANQVAHFLLEKGILPYQKVAVSLDRSPELIASQLAILKVGAIYVPIDPAYPAAREKYMIEDSEASAYISSSNRAEDDLGKIRATTIYVDKENFEKYSTKNPKLNFEAKGVDIIYTSGSTGNPKGIQQTHKARLNRFHWMWEKYPFSSDDVCCQKTPISFGDAIWETLGPLLKGVTLAIFSEDTVRDPTLFINALNRHKVTRIVVVPSLLQAMVELGSSKRLSLDTLKICIVSGEACPVPLTKKFLNFCSQALLINIYGSTEFCADATYYEVTGSESNRINLPIGKPLSNFHTYILDKHDNLLAPGIPGEIHISGMGVASGYLNNQELTNQKFVLNPYSKNKNHQILFKTGDLGRFLEDGNIEFLGRNDRQVKIRGARIELDEIQSVLAVHTNVKGAIVLAKGIQLEEKHIVAYVVLNKQSPYEKDKLSAKETLNSYLSEKLPLYMLPSYIVILDEFPLTPNGKIDFIKLKSEQYVHDSNQKEKQPPKSDLEKSLCQIWSRILSLPIDDVNLNFFEVGGHSILATKLAVQIREEIGVDIPIKEIFLNPTIAALINYINSQPAEVGDNFDIPKIERNKAHFPLSFSQQRLWFLEQLSPELNVYNVPAALRLTGLLDKKAIMDAIKEVIKRHEVLRASFIADSDGTAYQNISPTLDFECNYIDLSNSAKTSLQSIIQEKFNSELNKPFNLSKPPLLRCSLLRLSNNEHILVLAIHHIVTDAWSMELFFSELSELYNASLEHRVSQLPELPIQYIDFATWQRNHFTDTIIKKQLNYWREALSNTPDTSSLPTDYARPAEVSYKGTAYYYTIPTDVHHQLIELTRKYDVTMFVVLLTAFQAALHRFSNDETVVVGTPILNRHYPKVENLIGFFVNTLAMRLDISDSSMFLELLQKNKENVLEAQENQDVPFEQLVDDLKIRRDLSRHPIFQTWFVLQNKTDSLFKFKNLDVENIRVDEHISKFDLALWMKETEHNFELRLEYSTDLFKDSTIKQFISSFESFLKFASEHPQSKVDEVPIVNTEFNRRVSHQEKLPFNQEGTIIDVIEATSKEHGENVAIKAGEKELTYQDLLRQVNQLCHYLQPHVTSGQSKVVLALPRSFDAIVSTLAALKLGAAYIPLDLNWPEERIKHVLKDSESDIVLTHKKYSSFYKELGLKVFELDELRDQLRLESDKPLSVSIDPEQIAYIIYTSGSTGVPKGVLVPHRGLVNLAKEQSKLFEIDAQSRVLQFASLSFDAVVSEWSTTLSQGGCLCLLPEKNGKLTEDIVQVFQEESITVATLPPSLARILPVGTLKSLKTLVLAGESSSQSLVDKWVNQVKLINAYGPTEGTVCATAHVYKEGDGASIIGKALPHVQVYLLNKANQLVPPGVVGEIVIGGIGVAKGYLNREDLTQKSFIPDFIQNKKDHYLYRTGDLGRYREDGTIEYVGRTDHQVKLRGYRIELGEIEQTLRASPDVKEAVVLLKEIKTGQKALVVYIEPATESKEGDDLLKEKLKAFLQERLPGYMIPEHWLEVKEWPLTVSGKIDRQALLELELKKKEEAPQESDEPQSEIEKKLASLWCNVLRLDKVGVHDNFFRIGGDSISAIQFVSRAKQAGIQLSVKQVFKAPTISELKSLVSAPVDNLKTQDSRDMDNKVSTNSLSPSQSWFFEQELRNINHFNQAVLLESKEGIEEEALEKALQSLVKRHKSLQLRFYKDENGIWSQRYEEYESLEEYKKGICRIEDLEGLSNEEARKKQLEVAEEVQRSLNIQEGPLFQGVLFKEGEKDTLLLVCHHLVVDSVSWRILIEDLEAAYKQALEEKEEIDLPEGTRSYGWWTEALEKLANKEAYQEEISYWEDVLDQQGDPLPRDMEGTGENTVEHMGEVTAELPIDLTQKLLQEVPSAYRTQINDILLTALGYAVQEWTGTKRIGLILEGHGREQLTEEMDLSRTVGWFTSIYPVVLDLEGVESIGSGIKKVKETLRQIPRKGVGYGMLKYLTEEGRKRLSNKEEPDLSFNYLGQVDAGEEKTATFKMRAGEVGLSHSLKNKRKFLIEINARIIKGKFQVSASYCSKSHHQESIKKLLKCFKARLTNIIEEQGYETSFSSYIPSDFPLCALNQSALDYVVEKIAKPIEDLYPLSPMQNGLLSTAIRFNGPDPYLRQNLFELKGNIKPDFIKQAWQAVMGNEPMLRTGFIWENISKPLQFILKDLRIDWSEHDWQELPENSQKNKIQELINLDYEKSFDLQHPPLVRLNLIKLEPQRYWLLWSIHHILVDGWCSSILIKKFVTAYEQLNAQQKIMLPKSTPYYEYIEWVENQDLKKAESFWKEFLKDAKVTRLSKKKNNATNNQSQYRHFHMELSQKKNRASSRNSK
jgi:amino acid adenylation domain-containing protein/non-ribosomal peptide synthase protein (TIGR01720 family)